MREPTPKLLQRAMAYHQRGELENAARLYHQALEREPWNADALHLTGVVAHQQGRDEDAVALITKAIEKSPRAHVYRNNLGMALTALGRTEEAEAAYREALSIAPEFSDALLNLGNLRAGQGRFEEAVSLLKRSIGIDPRAPEAHYNLGRVRAVLGDSNGALDAFSRAAALGADFAELHFEFGAVHAALGDVAQAVSFYTKALDRDGDHLGAQHRLLECMHTLPMDVDADRLESVVTPLLRARGINTRALGHALARLMERKHALGMIHAPGQLSEELCEHLLDDEVARLYLQRTINVSVPLEHLLTQCRARWLAAAGDSASVHDRHWSRIGPVAIQCFLNEYVWAITAEEEQAVDALHKRIVAACESPIVTDAALISDLLVYSCYRPLWRMPCAARLRAVPAGNWPAPLDATLRVCLHEPLRELELRSRLGSSAAVRDRVSRAVQAQYEENPYPRWLAVTRGGVQSIEARVQRWCPDYIAPQALRGPLNVLVAGCGTGMDAIDTALHFHNARVTAIDLSRASLAYAMRKAEEYEVDNLDFRQEDILEFAGGDSPYHVVVCNGVLHHMQDPAAGLARLVALLAPEGLVKLALYSRIARAPLMQARRAIRASGLGSRDADIRTFRERVFEEGARGPFAELMGTTDFFSTSECRDLLFHAHETQLTLPELGRLLKNAGLEFLGFELPIAEVRQGFRREHGDAPITDLDAWHAYEQRHPESFRGMYHFWCRSTGRWDQYR